MSQSLQGKTTVITGGTTGIGLATAELFRAEGARVAITGKNPESLAEARRRLPPDVLVIRADTTSIPETEAAMAEVAAAFGHIDVLFANAGIARFAPIEAVTEAFYDELYNVNVRGAYFTIQRALPRLSEGASIILNTSVAATRGLANASVYGPTKSALAGMVRSLAVELAPRGIRVNAVSPGPIDTPIYTKLGFPADALAGFKATMTTKVPLGRFGTSQDVARSVLLLATAPFVTGVDLPVDGGLNAAA